MSEDLTKGFDELSQLLNEYGDQVNNIQDVLVEGAKAYVSDLSKLPRPKSKLIRTKSKHMLDTMKYRRADNDEVEVGTGVYWLRFVELGTKKMRGRYFMRDMWSKNKQKYNQIMINKIGL